MKALLNMPIYCKKCASRNSWVRNPDKDIKFVSGEVFEEAFKCLVCGATTIRPAPETGVTEQA